MSLDFALMFVGFLWAALVLYGFSVGWWCLETLVLSRGDRVTEEDLEWGEQDVQVRILTIDGESIVQATVNAVPDGLTDIHVIAEDDIDISGATVHTVPSEFTCDAINKGRAVEWARRNLPCEKEYVLYLDEDTLMAGFNGLPDADVVQYTEKPLYTGSRLSYLAEVFRIGYQFEQFGFHRLKYPLYVWGGGVAIRASLEDEITWDFATITEDTNFIWRAAQWRDISFRIVDSRFRNQAPPSLRALIQQRRRWISGTVSDGHILPRTYRPLYYTRIIAWACSPFVPLLVLGGYFGLHGPTATIYQTLSVAFSGMLFIYMIAGLRGFRKHLLVWPIFLLLTPLAALVHSIGALWGLLSPVRTFEVTEKVDPETVEDLHKPLDRGDLSDHDGTERLLRESDEETPVTVFDD